MVKVKVCGLADAQNYAQIVALRPDFTGHIFYPRSPRYIAPQELASWPKVAGVGRVGVFVNESAENVAGSADQAALDALQLHGDETPSYCYDLRKRAPAMLLIKSFAVHETFAWATLRDYADACDFFLFDTPSPARGGSGRVFAWEMLQQQELPRPFFLGGGLGPDNIAAALAACAGLPLYAADVNSRAEIRPGVKSLELVQRFISDSRTRN